MKSENAVYYSTVSFSDFDNDIMVIIPLFLGNNTLKYLVA